MWDTRFRAELKPGRDPKKLLRVCVGGGSMSGLWVTFPESIWGSPLSVLTLPLDLEGLLVPSPEADMMVS